MAKRKSNIYQTILEAVLNKKLKEPFNVKDCNDYCNNILAKSPAFISKHEEDNPTNQTAYFKKVSRGYYKVIRRI